MQVLESVKGAQSFFSQTRSEGPIAFVPTMGCLHEGHLELVAHAKSLAKRVAVSIFVNPLQFGPTEDFNKYPRTFEEDQLKLEKASVDYLFYPSSSELYPAGFSSTVNVGELANRLCGAFRPGHFDGVATIVLKLLQIIQPSFAIFGEKDFQQLRVIENMVMDLNVATSVVAHPTVRELDGLARSSRNRYLSESDRRRASQIPQALSAVTELCRNQISTTVQQALELAFLRLSGLETQYLEITHGQDLRSAPKEAFISELSSPRLFLAVKLGTTRLIDNISLKEPHL